MQYALINTDRLHTVERYMPSNYDAVALGEFVLVFGEDRAGWTLDGYVLPRMSQWGLGQVRDARVEYQDGTFSLIDANDEFGLPVDEVRVFTQYDWESQINLYKHREVPDYGYERYYDFSVQSEVLRLIEQSDDFGALDPTFDYQAAADYANHRLTVDGLLADEEA